MDFAKLDLQIEEYCKKHQISGMLRITVKDAILFEKNMGYADAEAKTPFTKDAMFTLYSLSKPFCALGLLRLVEAGRVLLAAHPSVYVPEAKGFDPAVTVRHLLNHTSGLPDFELNKEFAARYPHGYAHEVRGQLEALSVMPQVFAPGTKMLYANINFILSALIIEAVTGESYQTYMTREVFEPLGMKSAVVDNETKEIAHRVTGYALQDGVPIPAAKSHDWMLGAGDVVATVDDVYCLNTAAKCNLLVSKEMWEEILSRSDVGYFGYGCSVFDWHGKRMIRHNGGHEGFRTLHVWIPECDFDIIFLSNSGYGNARDDLTEMIHTAFFGKGGAYERHEMDAGYIKN